MNINSINIILRRWGDPRFFNIEGVEDENGSPFFTICQAKEGAYTLTLQMNPTQEVAQGGFFIAPSLATRRTIHHVNPQTNCFQSRWVMLDVMVNDTIPFDYAFDLPAFPNGETCAALNEVFDRLFATDDMLDRTICCYELFKVLMPLVSEKQNYEGHVAKALAYMKQNLHRTIAVDDIADVCGISASSLYRLFHHAMGCSPIIYFNSLKLSNAILLLEHTNYSLRQVATQCGFADPSYFSKLFKKRYGCAPSFYRSHVQQNKSL